MNKAKRNAKLMFTFVLTALAFLCSFNVTYSYFTATAKESGNLGFADLDVRFVYLDSLSNVLPTGSYTQDNLYTLNLYPVEGTIERGVEFHLSTTENGTAIKNLAIRNMAHSSIAYVRFWIDAYVVTGSTSNGDGSTSYLLDKTKNYGKYFFLTTNDTYYVRGDCNSSATEGSWCYYVGTQMYPHQQTNSTILLGNSLIMRDLGEGENIDPVPNDVLGSQLQISISLQAVQYANGAYTSVFDDAKGYCVYW